MSIYKSIITEALDESSTWAEIKAVLSTYNIHDLEKAKKDSRAGKAFEIFAKFFFMVSPSQCGNYKNVWLFEEAPLNVREQLNTGSIDHGVDLILEDYLSNYYVVQCKFRNEEGTTLSWSADKLAHLFASCPNAHGHILFSNASDIASFVKDRYKKRFSFISAADLHELDKETINNIYRQLTGQAQNPKTYTLPHPHQVEATNHCVDSFDQEERGQLILPCGAGKTLTALWIKEKLECQNTLVLVPSLSLLRQIKKDWAKERRTAYRHLCVCSEDSIDSDNDATVTHTYELGTSVSTDPAEIKDFLYQHNSEKVIFSTYHSLACIADAIAGTDFQFDLIFCDEAHRTAGVGMNNFSLVHDNKRVPAKRRLYATATPRIVKESLKKKLGVDLTYAYDMNDPATFGEEFYRMTFKDAIEKDILVDYKIIAVGVSDEELKECIDKRRFVDTHVSIDEIANNYALEHIMSKYKATHALTFHSRVALAEGFSKRHRELFSAVTAFAVNGKQTTSYRSQVLEQFKGSGKAVISNARCLTEGVDVPTIDLVYFCDPKNSKVDIVQAVGRALRKNHLQPEKNKAGLIVVPIFYTSKGNVEESISNSSFKNLLQVIRSLCDQDERLQDEINRIALGKGERRSERLEIVNGFFSEEQDMILLEGFDERLRGSLFDQIIEKTSNSWGMWFMQLHTYLKKSDNYYPSKETNPELYRWVMQQRTKRKRGNLKNEEIRKLNSIAFIWDQQEWKWNSMYKQLVQYAQTNMFEPSKENDLELYSWYSAVKSQKAQGKLRKDRLQKFNSVKFSGSAIEAKWALSYDMLMEYRKANPSKWPQYDRSNPDTEECKLHNFCQMMRSRYKTNELSAYWINKMAELNFNFEGWVDTWTESYNKIKESIDGKDTISIKSIGSSSYGWLRRHYNNLLKGKLPEDRAKLIDELQLERFFVSWDETYKQVQIYVQKNGRIPTQKGDKKLHSWLYSQRFRYDGGKLNAKQIKQLRLVGFDLDGKGLEENEKNWLQKLLEYQEFKDFNDREPSYLKGGKEKQLYNWASAQRAAMAGNLRNRKPLSQSRVNKLNEINFNWIGEGVKLNDWDECIRKVSSFITTEGKLCLPSRVDGKTSALYMWWLRQKTAFKKGKLNENQISKILELGIDLNEGLQHRVEAVRERGYYYN